MPTWTAHIRKASYDEQSGKKRRSIVTSMSSVRWPNSAMGCAPAICGSRKAISIVNYHHRHPFSAHWGDGTTSSSDGQRFPVGGPRSHTAQINGKYGPEPGLVFYTHISFQACSSRFFSKRKLFLREPLAACHCWLFRCSSQVTFYSSVCYHLERALVSEAF